MRFVETERNLFKFYGIVAFITILYCGLGTGMVYGFLTRENAAWPKDYFFFALGCVCFCVAIYTIIRFFKNAPVITVDKEEITFNGVAYLWSEMTHIDLTGKQPFKCFFRYPKDGAKLTLQDGTVKYFFDDMYSNTWKIKSFIQQVVIDKAAVAEINPPEANENELPIERFETFKGNQFLSFEGIFFWAMIAGFVLAALKCLGRQALNGLILALFSLLWFVIGSYRMHYFELSDKHLVVKNHNFFWKKKIIRLSDIKEISFEAPGRLPNSMRIITKDFRNKLYPAGTLRGPTWLDLKNKLELKGITVSIH